LGLRFFIIFFYGGSVSPTTNKTALSIITVSNGCKSETLLNIEGKSSLTDTRLHHETRYVSQRDLKHLIVTEFIYRIAKIIETRDTTSGTWDTPILERSRELSNFDNSQYLDG
jgi:hypothetical protein